MNKYAKWITNTIITLLLVFVGLLLTILVVYIVNDSFKEQDTILAGCIGFVGAVIGGYLTWSGVRYSIEHQKAKDRLERLPDTLKKCWQINTKYIAFGTVLAAKLDKKDFIKEDVESTIDNFYKQTEEIATELALDVSHEMYRIIMRYYTLLTDFGPYVAKNKLDDFITELLEITFKTMKMIESLEDEYEKLGESLKVEV